MYKDQMSRIKVKCTIPHVGQNCVKNTTSAVDSVSVLVCTSPADSNKLFAALFRQVIKISLNKM